MHHRMRSVVQHHGRHEWSASTLGEPDGDTESKKDVCASDQSSQCITLTTTDNVPKPEQQTTLDSAVLARSVLSSISQDMNIDLARHEEAIQSEMATMLRDAKAHYENEVWEVARKGHLPARTPSTIMRRKDALAKLVRRVKHVYTKKQRSLGGHTAFVEKMFLRNYGSLLVTGTQNSFDHFLGSAFELTDLVLGRLLPDNFTLELPLCNRSSMGWSEETKTCVRKYINLFLTSRRIRMLAQDVMAQRLGLHINTTKGSIYEGLATALKAKGPLPSFVHRGLRTINHFASIAHLELSLPSYEGFDQPYADALTRNLPLVQALTNMISSLGRLKLSISSRFQHLAFSSRGRPALWLTNIIASLPFNARIELYIDDYQVREVQYDCAHELLPFKKPQSVFYTAELAKLLTDRHLYVLGFFLHISQLLINGHASATQLRLPVIRGEPSSPSRQKVSASRFHDMMSRFLRERGKDDIADWFEDYRY